ncbi:MAG: thiol-disulfide oxidoreductase DCC family protein [Chitinophagaceae bacterium]
METTSHQHIVLFDGVCNLCSRTVQFIIKKDKQKIFRFAALQSEIGQQILAATGGLDNHQLTSIVYIQNNHTYIKSDAALMIARQLGGMYTVVSWLRIVPRTMRDAVYGFIAKNRYKWFGKKKECWLPTKELKERFL